MVKRKEPFVTGETYHVFNKSVAGEKIFTDIKFSNRFLELVNYYRHENNSLRYSYFKKLTPKSQNEYLSSLYDSASKVDLISFCIMPNHYHFLVKQNVSKGIEDFVRTIQIGFSKFYNLVNERQGSVFLTQFKAVRIKTEEQLIHTSRYIHLNPVTSNMIDIKELDQYPHTSFVDYISEEPRKFLTTSISDHFESRREYDEFVKNRADYQRNLHLINHTSEV